MLANDIRNFRRISYISHGWGKKPEQKEAERKYNHEYYMKHKKEKGKGKQLDEKVSGGVNFAKGGLIGVAAGAISDLTKSDREKEIANTPCNVLIYNDGSETDGYGEKYIAKMKINGHGGQQYWKYFYTDYQIQTYQNLVNKVTDNRDNSDQSGYLDSKNLDELDGLLLKFDLKREPMTEEEDAKLVNPNYDEYNPETSENCVYCSEAYCMRRMGFDVVAEERVSQDNNWSIDIDDWRNSDEIATDTHIIDYRSGSVDYTKYNVGYGDEKAYDSTTVEKLIASNGDGACGSIGMYWYTGGGHSIVWENKNGKTYFRDTQDSTRKVYTDLSWYNDYGAVCYTYVRLDNQLPDSGISSVKARNGNSYGSITNEKVSDKEKYKPGIFETLYD